MWCEDSVISYNLGSDLQIMKYCLTGQIRGGGVSLISSTALNSADVYLLSTIC